jgi:hypothetical protein
VVLRVAGSNPVIHPKYNKKIKLPQGAFLLAMEVTGFLHAKDGDYLRLFISFATTDKSLLS